MIEVLEENKCMALKNHTYIRETFFAEQEENISTDVFASKALALLSKLPYDRSLKGEYSARYLRTIII